MSIAPSVTQAFLFATIQAFDHVPDVRLGLLGAGIENAEFSIPGCKRTQYAAVGHTAAHSTMNNNVSAVVTLICNAYLFKSQP